jgi:CubicO group peptidase (beta-lactamase class C family)
MTMAGLALSSPSTAFPGARRGGSDGASTGYYPSTDEAGGWRTVKGRNEVRKVAGLDVDRLDQAFAYAQTTSRFGGLLVARHGYLAYERYFGRATREVTPNMASCRKMFTSACWGILLHEKPGLVPEQLEQKVFTATYLPEALPPRDPRKGNIKLGHLLAMTSGLAESNRNPGIVNGNDVKVETTLIDLGKLDQDQSALQTPMWNEPGGGYFYSSQGVHVVSIVLRHLVGMEMQKYIDQKLAKPMQFGGWGYGTDRANGTKLEHTPGGAGIALRATDILRFGYLLLRNGYWQGQSLIPADYIRPFDQFHDGPINGDAGTRRTLEMVIASIV